MIVTPKTIEEAANLVADAHEKGRTVWPKGGGTRVAPRDADVVIDLTALDRIVEHKPEDLVASVQCGITFSELQKKLAKRGQRIPLDPACRDGSTIGGILATNAFGPRRLKYGTARDWVIGTTLVRFDGKIVRSGGMVVKNVSGYDLSKLYVGSFGSLGILVQANFKLEPIPKARATYVAEVSRREAWAVVTDLLNRPLPLVSAVYSDRLVVGFEGREEGCQNCSAVLTTCKPVVLAEMPAFIRLHYPPASYLSLMDQVGPVEYEFSLLGSGVTWLGWKKAPPAQTIDRLRKTGRLFIERFDAPIRRWELSGGMARIKSALDPKMTFPALA